MAIDSPEFAPAEAIFSSEELSKLKKVKERVDKAKDLIAPQQADDEFHEDPETVILKPLRRVLTTGGEEKDQESNQHLEGEFVYLSQTRKLEVNTARTQAIQQVVDRMTNGTQLETRVVIMQKGRASEAFVTPDGTIFISQSLLNKLDYEDEIAGVLAHELGHLVFKTHGRVGDISRPGSKFAVGWVHEEACDLYAPRLLERAGFNSMAFGSAIEKISGTHRGSIHQSGLARASQSVGAHFGVNYTTSNVPLTPLQESLRGKVEKTNLEIAHEEKNKPVGSRFETVIRKLHRYDLEQLRGDLDKVSEDQKGPIRKINSLIDERLIEVGMSEPARKLFLICLDGPHSSKDLELELFKNPQDLIDIVSELESFEMGGVGHKMYRNIFGREYGFGWSFQDYPIQRIENLMADYLYDQNFEQGKGIPLTREDLFKATEILSNTKSNFRRSGHNSPGMADIYISYLERTYLKMAAYANTDLDPSQMGEFFQEIKDRKIAVDPREMIHLLRSEFRGSPWEDGRKIEFTQENKQIAIDSLIRIFEIKDKYFGFEEIDQAFEIIKDPNLHDAEFQARFQTLISGLVWGFEQQGFDDTKRAEFLLYIYNKIGESNLETQLLLTKYLNGSNNYYREYRSSPAGEDILATPVMSFHLKMLFGLTLLEKDGPEFYEYMTKIMQESGIDPNNLTQTQLLNLCAPMLSLHSSHQKLPFFGRGRITETDGLDVVKVNDHAAFFELPFIKALRENEQSLDFTNIGQLLEYTTNLVENCHRIRDYLGKTNDIDVNIIFSNSALSLIVGRNIEQNLERILEQGVKDTEFGDLYTFIKNYFPDEPGKQQYLKELNKRYLQSSGVDFEQKLEYLLNNFDRVGAEGAVILAEQIEDIGTFRRFMQAVGSQIETYLDGGGIATYVAAGDFASSYLTKHFSYVLRTSEPSPAMQKEVSTDLAHDWIQGAVFSYQTPGSSVGTIHLDKESLKFNLDNFSRPGFRTLTDSFKALQSLSPLERFTIAHKVLTDTDGALTSAENRSTLANTLVKSLGLKDRFVASALSIACREADAKLIGFPVSNMLAPLFFRALNVEAIDYQKLGKDEVFDPKKEWTDIQSVPLQSVFNQDQLHYFFDSSTREVTMFGANMLSQPDSLAARLVRESDQSYHAINDRLSLLLNIRGAAESPGSETQSPVDPAIEAVLRGIELSGALGARSMQLSSQFVHFSNPEMARRFSQSFDSNPGMINKLVFWYNLDKLVQENPEIEALVQKVKVDGRAGAGSLQTTYFGRYTDENGVEQRVVLKQRNPNVIRFIGEVYSNASRVLEQVGRTANPRSRNLAQTGLALLDLSRKWCLEDLNDHSFEEDDDKYRQVVDRFNGTSGQEIFSVPDRVFTDVSLKLEGQSEGRTLNQMLNDESVGFETKQQAVAAIGRLFKFQLNPENLIPDEQGRQVVLAHSDPSVGNFVVDVRTGEPRIGVIDRSMFLKLEQADVALLDKLIGGGSDNDFVYGFVDRVLDLNKVRGVSRIAVGARVLGKLGAEYALQRSRGSINRLVLMRTMMTELSATKMDVPLNLRLMIRNIGAMQELMRRYDLDLTKV